MFASYFIMVPLSLVCPVYDPFGSIRNIVATGPILGWRLKCEGLVFLFGWQVNVETKGPLRCKYVWLKGMLACSLHSTPQT